MALEVRGRYLELLLSIGFREFSTDSLVHFAQLCKNELDLDEAFSGVFNIEIQLLFMGQELFDHAFIRIAAVVLSNLV